LYRVADYDILALLNERHARLRERLQLLNLTPVSTAEADTCCLRRFCELGPGWVHTLPQWTLLLNLSTPVYHLYLLLWVHVCGYVQGTGLTCAYR
jgi:hypothetical protein